MHNDNAAELSDAQLQEAVDRIHMAEFVLARGRDTRFR